MSALSRLFILAISTFLMLTISPLDSVVKASNPGSDNDTYEERLAELANFFKSEGLNIDEILSDSRFELYEDIGKKFTNSAEKRTLNLEEYKGVLGFADKKSRISEFINDNRTQLEKAEAEYGIPKYVIAAIIGIESDFGNNIGQHNPFNAYASMYAVDYRADFAKAQLKELILFVERHEIDVYELKSSYAGAMTFAQFIPYSLNKWFVGDDIFDMNNNIMSVANYLAYFKNITGSVDRAVFRYNPSELYTSAVMALAEEAETMI
ncbi:MAG: lytic murein transglycosylase [Balneolaceae bacterium]